MKYLIIILLFQFLLATLYIISAYRNGKAIPFEKVSVTAFIPVLGIFIPYMGTLFNYGSLDMDVELFNHDDLDLTDGTSYMKKNDSEYAVNIIPVEEAMILNDSDVRRRILINTISEDAANHINFLKMAVLDSDIETSHYASSIIMEIKRELHGLIQKTSVEYENNKNDFETQKLYLDLIEKYLNSGLLDERSTKRYQEVYLKLLEERLAIGISEEKYFIEKINLEMKLGRLYNCKTWIDKYCEVYPDYENPHILLLKYYYLKNDVESFDKALIGIKNKHINFSKNGLDIIRFWSDRSE